MFGQPKTNPIHGGQMKTGGFTPRRAMAAFRSLDSAKTANVMRLGGSGAMGLMALSQGGKTLESLRYGEVGQAAMHATLMAGAGYGAYHSFYRTKSFNNATAYASAYMQHNAGKLGKHNRGLNTVANKISGIFRHM